MQLYINIHIYVDLDYGVIITSADCLVSAAQPQLHASPASFANLNSHSVGYNRSATCMIDLSLVS